MPNRKETSKAPLSEAVEEDPSFKDQVELLMMQLEEVKRVVQEAQQKALAEEVSHDKESGAVEIEGGDQVRELHSLRDELEASQSEWNEMAGGLQCLEKCTRVSGYSGHVMGHYSREFLEKMKVEKQGN